MADLIDRAMTTDRVAADMAAILKREAIDAKVAMEILGGLIEAACLQYYHDGPGAAALALSQVTSEAWDRAYPKGNPK